MNSKLVSNFKLKSFISLLISLVLTFSMIPAIALPKTVAHAENNDDQKSSWGEDSSYFKITPGSWTSVGNDKRFSFDVDLNTKRFTETHEDLDILFLVDMGATNRAEEFQGLVNQSIIRTKQMSPNSRYSIIGFSDGWVVDTGDFKSDLVPTGFSNGTFSDWTFGFEKSIERINNREDKSRKTQVIFVTTFQNPNLNGSNFDSVAGRLKSVADNVSVISSNDSDRYKKIATSNDYIYRFKDQINKSYQYPHLIYGFEEIEHDRIYSFIKNVEITIPLKENFSFMASFSGGYGNYSFKGNGSEIKLKLDKMSIEKSLHLSASVSYSGTSTEVLPITDKAYVEYEFEGQKHGYSHAGISAELKAYHVIYDLNGGTGIKELTDDSLYFKGDTVYPKYGKMLTKGTDTFSGWKLISGNAEKDEKNPMQYKITGDGDVIFQAQYSGIYVHADAQELIKPSTTLKKFGKFEKVFYDKSILDRPDGDYRSRYVDSIEFRDSVVIPDNSIKIWNSGEDNGNGVVGWATEELMTYENGNPYFGVHITFACEGEYPSLPDNCYYMFAYFEYATKLINFDKLDTSNVTNMYGMFLDFGRESVELNKNVIGDFSKMNTSNVTIVQSMFSMSKFDVIDLSNSNFYNVENFIAMFYGCDKLKKLIFNSNYKTINARNYYQFFDGCSSLTKLDLSFIDSTKVENYGRMFRNCSNLSEIDLTNFDVGNTSYISFLGLENMFSGCSNLKSIDISSFNISRCSIMYDMFSGCSSLEDIDLSNLDWSYNPRISRMFSGCSSLKSIDTNTIKKNLSNDDCYGLFEDCSSLSSIDLSPLNTSNVTNMREMFKGCTSLTNLDFSNFDTSRVTNMKGLFSGMTSLSQLNLSNFVTSKVMDISSMFEGCSALETIDLSKFNTSVVTDMNSIFKGCSSLESINISMINTSKVKDFSYMFEGCTNLTSLNLSNINTSSATKMGHMFSGCTSLGDLTLEGWDISNVKDYKVENRVDIYYTDIFKDFPGNLTLKNFTISSNTLYNDMFAIIGDSIELVNWKGSTSLNRMFKGCTASTIKLTNFDTSNVTSTTEMFSGCKNLILLDLSSFNSSKVTNFTDMFKDAFVQDTNSKLIYRSSDELTRYQNSGNLSRNITYELTTNTNQLLTYSDPLQLNNSLNINDYFSRNNKDFDSSDSVLNEPEANLDDLQSETQYESQTDEIENHYVDNLPYNRAYADEVDNSDIDNNTFTSVPDSYKEKIDGGEITYSPAEITYSLDIMNFGDFGNSDEISASCKIPDGLSFVENSFVFSETPQRITEGDGGAAEGKILEMPAYNDTTKTITVRVNNLSAGAYFRIGFVCKLESLPDHFTQYVLNADYSTSNGISSTSNNVVHYAFEKPADLYDVSYSQDGEMPEASISLPDTMQYAEGESVTLPSIPSFVGYSASAWKVVKTDDGSEVEITDGRFIMPASNVSITTTWSKDPDPEVFKVKFSFTGNAESDYPIEALSALPKEVELNEGDRVYIPNINGNDYEGWTFNGFNLNDIEIDADSNSFVMPSRDFEIFGSWSKKTYKIYFNKGATGPASGYTLPQTMDVAWGETVNYPVDATYSGDESFTFIGWTNDAGVDINKPFTMPKQNITFTGNWLGAKLYKISIKNGISSQNVAKAGESITIETSLPEHSIFNSWNVVTGGVNLVDSNEETTSFEMPENDVEIVADYTPITTYVINFVSNGGEGVMQSMTCEHGQNYKLISNEFVRKGYEFLGWATDANSNVVEYTDGQSIVDLIEPDNEITLYAVWKEAQQVIVNDENSSDLEPASDTSIATPISVKQLSETGDVYMFVILEIVILAMAITPVLIFGFVKRRRARTGR